MEPSLVKDLRRQRKEIRRRWEAFLRLEKVASPLANPDTLVFGVDHTLSEIFSGLLRPARPRRSPGAARECGCDRHPLRAYYRAGEQAVLEALVLAQVRRAPLAAAERDREFAEVKAVVTALARRDIDALARVCRLAPEPAAGGKTDGAAGRRRKSRD
ncbi:MAG: hypothetical protein C0502_05405 [Opitutus sp.]|nr:hypothetical protein [Opitutus sp.]